MIDLLSQYSHDIFELTWAGQVDRVREVLREDTARAKIHSSGNTPLMWLPDDEGTALELVGLLLEAGADPALQNTEGKTAADRAMARGMYDVASVLRSRGG
jgi:ankyrin repeat protein